MFYSLLNQPSCQGQFLSNGTCWLKVSGRSDNLCTWGYFLCWVFIFYISSASVIAYAYMRIRRGLESTYITRFKCVKDTLWFVALYFLYACAVGLLFLMATVVLPSEGQNSKELMRNLEHLFAYLIACRGFFDALIWSFSHSSPPSNLRKSRSSSGKRGSLCTRLQIAVSSFIREEGDTERGIPREHLLENEEDEGTGDRQDKTESGQRYTDFDLSPQLNFALRSELLLLVSMGIKESVMRLKRDYSSVPPPVGSTTGGGDFEESIRLDSKEQLLGENASITNGKL